MKNDEEPVIKPFIEEENTRKFWKSGYFLSWKYPTERVENFALGSSFFNSDFGITEVCFRWRTKCGWRLWGCGFSSFRFANTKSIKFVTLCWSKGRLASDVTASVVGGAGVETIKGVAVDAADMDERYFRSYPSDFVIYLHHKHFSFSISLSLFSLSLSPPLSPSHQSFPCGSGTLGGQTPTSWSNVNPPSASLSAPMCMWWKHYGRFASEMEEWDHGKREDRGGLIKEEKRDEERRRD